MSEDKIFDMVKTCFENQSKETVVEYLSTLLAKLATNGVSIGAVPLESEYIEYTDENELIQRIYAKYNKSPIRDSLAIDFTKHDEKVRNELRKEFLEKIPAPDKRRYDL